MKRETLVLEIADQTLVGTIHLPHESTKTSRLTGVLMLSFGQQPRSWVGDLGIAVADQVVAAGYPAFRFDMPGLGDAPGELPVHLEELWRSIQEGAHEPIARALVKELKRRFGLRGLVVGGFCGGAVTAGLAIDPKGRDTAGLIMLEPEIGLTPVPSAEGRAVHQIDTVASFVERVDLIKRRLRSVDSWRRLLSGKSDLKYWKGLLDYVLARRRNASKTDNLPPDTNRRLMDVWARCARQRLPMLVVTAGGNRHKYYEGYGLKPGQSDPATALTWLEIENTTHALLAGGAKRDVPTFIERWLREQFPESRDVRTSGGRLGAPDEAASLTG